MLIASRVLQGLAGGGLQPSSQGVLLDAFPQEKQGAAQTIFGIAALLAPVVGPTLGGYITDNYGWRWIFYLNLPVGLFALWMCSTVVHDPAYLQSRASRDAQEAARPFDTLGLCLLSLTMVCWEIVLSKGQEWDWFGDPFLRVQTLLILFVLCLGGLICRELRIANPLINFRTLADRNFRCVLHHHFLRLRRALRQHHHAARPAAIALRLRRHHLRPRAFARGHLRGHDALHRRRCCSRAASMRAISWPAGSSRSASATSGCRA